MRRIFEVLLAAGLRGTFPPWTDKVIGSVADTVGNFVLDHPVLNDFLSWLDN